MKRVIALIFLFSLVLSFTSCEDFLSEDPKGMISDTYGKSEEGIESLVLSLYQSNRNLVERMFKFADAGTDLTTYSTNGVGWPYEEGMSYNDAILISNRYNSQYWRWLYNSLNLANTAIQYVQESSLSNEEKRDYLLSEAHALRAFYFFMIVETWGPGAHYADTPSQSVITEGYQPGIAVFYQKILEDMDIAAQNLKLPQETEWGRMNQGILKALRMRVLMALAAYDDDIISSTSYTKQKCYEETIMLCNSLISDYGYQLLGNYQDIFDVNNQINNEIIWSVQYTSDTKYNGTTDNDANYLHRYFVGWYNKSIKNTNLNIDGLWSHSIAYGREYRTAMPTYSYITSFSKFDKRREQTFQTVWCRIPDNWNNDPILTDTLLIRSLDPVSTQRMDEYMQRGIHLDDITEVYNVETGKPTLNGRSCHNTITKFLDPSRDEAKREYSFKDVILMRLGEVYITLAEACVRTNQPDKAAETITNLRNRALIPGHEDELKVTAGDMTMDFILEEGGRELGCELYRWYMLKRSGDFVNWIKSHNPDITTIQSYHIYRPIPQDALYEVTNLDEFVQNQGYK